MSDEAKEPDEQNEGSDGGQEPDDDKKSPRDKVGDGIKQGIGVLSAFKDALEETIQEARERGDLSSDKAKEVMKDALGKAQAAGERARDRLDRSAPSEMAAMQSAVDAIRERVSKLEESVFGDSRASGATDDDGDDDGAEAPEEKAEE